jgi:hypothetical protein
VPLHPPLDTEYRNTFGFVAVKLLASGVNRVVAPDELMPDPDTVLQVPPGTEGKLLIVMGALPTQVLTVFPADTKGSVKVIDTAPVVTCTVRVVLT